MPYAKKNINPTVDDDDDSSDPFAEDSTVELEDKVVSKASQKASSDDIKSVSQVISEHPQLADLGARLRNAEAKGDIVEQQKILDTVIRTVMVKGEDYGEIPGIPKPTLLKGGAEKIAAVYNLSADFTVFFRESDWKATREIVTKYKTINVTGFVAYELKCSLLDRVSGVQSGSGVGAGNTFEKKFASQGDGFDTHNTVFKMTKKRAFVDAILSRSLISGKFTQDVEDMDLSDREPKNSYPKPSTPTPSTSSSPTRPAESNDEAPWPAGKKILFDLTEHQGKNLTINEISTDAIRAYISAAEYNIKKDKFAALNRGFITAAKKVLETRTD